MTPYHEKLSDNAKMVAKRANELFDPLGRVYIMQDLMLHGVCRRCRKEIGAMECFYRVEGVRLEEDQTCPYPGADDAHVDLCRGCVEW